MSARRSFSRSSILAIAMLGWAATPTAMAGPFTDFERALVQAYAPYRAALFQTNQKERAASEKSLAAFEAAWTKLMEAHRGAPPPQYSDDPKWGETVTTIDRLIATSKAEIAKGELAKAHDTLEGIRDQLGELRIRNGLMTLSDRIDAYHEKMEHVLSAKYAGAEGTGALREDAAVLQYMVGAIEKHAPSGLKSNAEFRELLAALVAATNALQNAARLGDAPAIEKALKGLKPAYARLFVKFG